MVKLIIDRSSNNELFEKNNKALNLLKSCINCKQPN